MTGNIDDLAAPFLSRYSFDHVVQVRVGDCTGAVRSNSAALIALLRDYFEPFETRGGEPDLEVVAIECEPPVFGLDFEDWPRDPGKVGQKEQVADLEGGRVVKKVRTGMQFLLGQQLRVGLGPCVTNYNQIVNFLNAQYITWLLDRDYELCHAAGVVVDGAGLAIAAKSGGGKSTLAMHLMSDGASFTSNDRLLVRDTGAGIEMAGVPKLPRINPGTVLNNPDLAGIIPPERCAVLEDLPKGELWALEEKYDVPISTAFGADRFAMAAPLDCVMILTWSHTSDEPAKFERVDLNERPDLLPAIMKPPGAFYLPTDGTPPPEPLSVVEASYLRHLGGATVFEASGGVDFAAAVRFCKGQLREHARA